MVLPQVTRANENDYDKMVALLQEGDQLYRETRKSRARHEAIALDFQRCIEIMEEVIPIAEADDNKPVLVYAEHIIFSCLNELGRSSDFLSRLPRLQDLFDFEYPETPKLLSDVGRAYKSISDLQNAELYFQKALQRAHWRPKKGADLFRADMHSNIGGLHLNKNGDKAFAEAHYRRGIFLLGNPTRKNRGWRERHGKLYGNLARCLRLQERYPEALEQVRISLHDRQLLGEAASIANAEHEIGLIFYKMGLSDSALHHFELARETYPNGGPEFELRCWIYLLEAHLQAGNEGPVKSCIEAARFLLEGELQGSQVEEVRWFWETEAKYRVMRGDMEGGKSSLLRALSMTAVSEENLDAIPRVSHIRHHSQAYRTMGRYIGFLFPDSLQGGPEWEEEALQGVVYLDSILQILRTRQLREGSKYLLAKSAKPTYETGIRIALLRFEATGELRYLDRANYFLERSKALALSEAARAVGPLPQWIIEDSTWIKKRKLTIRLAQCDAEILSVPQASPRYQGLEARRFALQDALDSLDQDLRLRFPRYHQYIYDSPPPSLDTIQSQLGPDQMLLNFFAGQRQTTIIALSAEDEAAFTFPANASTHAELLHFARQVSEGAENYHFLAAKLHATYLKDILHRFPQKRILLCADGAFHFIPFAAFLTDTVDTTALPRTLPFLLRERILSRHFSASLFVQRPAPLPTSSFSYLGVAPDFAGTTLNEIPAAREEVADVSRLFPEGFTLCKSRISKSRFLELLYSKNFRYLHFSTHAAASVDSLGSAYIALGKAAEGTADEPRLYLNEIAPLHIQSQLIVLNGCETGGGQLEQGEGVLSLSREFYKGGSQAVLSTLWQVEEASSGRLMRTFFERTRQGKALDIALNEAQLQYLASNRGGANLKHPRYWSGFVLSGNVRDSVALPAKPSYWTTLLVLLGLLACLWWIRRSHQNHAV